METFVFKFSACLAVFWLVYILFLERERMHHLKRFYLLGAVVISIIIPLFTITHYIEPVVITNFERTQSFSPITDSQIEISQVEPPFWNLEKILYALYSCGALLFAIRFMFNLLSMFRRISGNEQINKGDFIYVLLKDYRIPHSFFKYLFFNKTNYESNAIPLEVQLHEETHASQWHSLDIVLIEMLQIVFWFHPLIYILKHHIKLNHEFLADQAVLDDGIDTKAYQKVLLQFSSNAHEYQLSSTINYSSIKKRFTVMKTHTSKTRMWLSSLLLLLPIIAILFYSFAEARYVERAPIEKSELLQKEFNTQAEEADVTTYRQLTEQYLTALSAYKKETQFDFSELKVLYTKTYQLYKSFSKSEIDTYKILPPPPVPIGENSR